MEARARERAKRREREKLSLWDSEVGAALTIYSELHFVRELAISIAVN